ncbi:MAG: hypothetical protein M3229_05290 [Actinomycetota bacterium]|nr:hypothetical protein [Actinomycetota bacterium]
MTGSLRAVCVAVCAALVVALAAPPTASAWRFTFYKHTNIHSNLSFAWVDPYDGLVYSASWRAGSGVSTNACWVDHGWLPSGYYDVNGHVDHFDDRIKGRVWRLGDKRCSNGQFRTALFIHTEENPWHGQWCEPWCWDGDVDYYSEGCIKVAYPYDIGALHSRYHAYGWNAHGWYTAPNALYVYG